MALVWIRDEKIVASSNCNTNRTFETITNRSDCASAVGLGDTSTGVRIPVVNRDDSTSVAAYPRLSASTVIDVIAVQVYGVARSSRTYLKKTNRRVLSGVADDTPCLSGGSDTIV